MDYNFNIGNILQVNYTLQELVLLELVKMGLIPTLFALWRINKGILLPTVVIRI